MNTLKVEFTPEDLTFIRDNNMRLIIAKPGNGKQPNVAWQSISPLLLNTITWNEEYGIFAAMGGLQTGTSIAMFAATPMGTAMNKVYSFDSNYTISGPISDGAPSAYSLVNNCQAQFNIGAGLCLDATVNGNNIMRNAVSAENLLFFAQASFFPGSNVYLWLHSDIVSNTIIDPNLPFASQFQFGNGVDTISVKYDSGSKKFISNPS